MPYPEYLIAPMRGEMTDMGARELRTAQAVEEVVTNSDGVVMLVVNSVCGCAAGKARPGIAKALQNKNRPDVVATVFAGADIEATDRARQYFAGYAPSSPSLGLLRGGKLIYMMERSQIEVRNAEMIAEELTKAFDRYCSDTRSAAL
jgi:putative YphP/YqiW family bacilliredoxin